MIIKVQFDGSYYPVDSNYLPTITGAVVARAALFHYRAELETVSRLAYQEWLSNFPEKKDYDIENVLDFTAIYSLENTCGYLVDTPYSLLETKPGVVALVASRKYGPVLKGLIDRMAEAGQDLGGYFLKKYGNFYRQALEAEPHAPIYAFAAGTLAAGLPLSDWVYSTHSAISEELGRFELDEVEAA